MDSLLISQRFFGEGVETTRLEEGLMLVREFPFGSSLVLRTVVLDHSLVLACALRPSEGWEMGDDISVLDFRLRAMIIGLVSNIRGIRIESQS